MDIVIIGQYVGSVGTVGVSAGGELSDIMTPVSTAFATAGQVYISRHFDVGDRKRLHEAIGTILTLMMGLSFLFMLGSIVFCRKILAALNCPGEAFSQAIAYMVIMAMGIFVCLIGPFNAVVTGSGFAALWFVIGILDGVICRIGVSLLLSRVLEMGVLSFWWANSLCRILPCLLCRCCHRNGRPLWNPRGNHNGLLLSGGIGHPIMDKRFHAPSGKAAAE